MARMLTCALFVSIAAFASAQPNEVALGHGFGCGLDDSGVRCWGSSRTGQCGVEERGVSVRPITGTAGAADVGAGYTFACARVDTEVRCWGDNRYGQLGREGVERSIEAVAVDGLPPASALAVANFSACAIAEGAVLCWGLGERGQLGPRFEAQSAAPVRIPRVRGATRIFAGHNHFCAEDGRGLTCWGNNSYGQTGARRARRSAPTRVRRTGDIADVALGDAFSCVLSPEGEVRCWGSNLLTIGDGQGNLRRPTHDPRLDGTTAIAAAGENACIVRGGAIQCLGVNRQGELHVPTNEAGGIVIVPSALPGVSDAARLAMHSSAQCYANASGQWRCWGWNRSSTNQVGVGATSRHVATPQPLQW
ncbi:MAG: hypothetical protein AAF411_17630 [Myxococcota bacterium]